MKRTRNTQTHTHTYNGVIKQGLTHLPTLWVKRELGKGCGIIYSALLER